MPDSTEMVTVDDVEMRKFTITMELDQNAVVDGLFSDSGDESDAGSETITSVATAEYPGEDS